jgi:hypothetical protein
MFHRECREVCVCRKIAACTVLPQKLLEHSKVMRGRLHNNGILAFKPAFDDPSPRRNPEKRR